MDVAVVTGASMGLGEEFARQLAARRANLLLVARSEAPMRALAAELEAAHGIRALVFCCDLSQPGAAAAVSEFVRESSLAPTWLVNNAGLGTVGPLDAIDPETIRRTLMVNVVALAELTRLLLPEMRLQRHARIINVSSTASFQPVPFFAAYAASKAFVTSFSEALSEELRGTGVRVLCLCPGPTPTKFADNNGLNAALLDRGQSAADVVRMGLEGADRGRAFVACQRKWALLVQRFLPRAAVRYIAGAVARGMLKKALAA